jgi:hypothetical protein
MYFHLPPIADSVIRCARIHAYHSLSTCSASKLFRRNPRIFAFKICASVPSYFDINTSKCSDTINQTPIRGLLLLWPLILGASQPVQADSGRGGFATQESLWLQLLLTELNGNRLELTKILLPKPTIIHADNQGAIALSRNPAFHAWTKHVNIKYLFIRKEVLSGNVKFAYINPSAQGGEGLTKPLEKSPFDRFIKQLGMRCFPMSTT